METSLLHFVFDVTTAILTEIIEHLTEHPLQGVVAHSTPRFIRCLHGEIPVVRDIEGRAVEMTRVLCGITVVMTQFVDILLRAEHTGDDKLMKRNALDLQTVIVSPSDIVEENGCTGHEIRDAAVHLVDMVIR